MHFAMKHPFDYMTHMCVVHQIKLTFGERGTTNRKTKDPEEEEEADAMRFLLYNSTYHQHQMIYYVSNVSTSVVICVYACAVFGTNTQRPTEHVIIIHELCDDHSKSFST